jgi:predicted ATP-grasp superfamily ATP-dependent carboligase
MRVGCFHVHDPVPELNEPYAFASLSPWIDVNGVGSLVLRELETRLGATELAVLSRPGRFYDYTRYRPTIRIEDGIRDLSIPTTHLHYATRKGRNDIILLRLQEPHATSEFYVDSVVKLLKTLGTKRYVLLGSMYDMVPHTRPLLISGYGMGKEAREEVRKAHALPLVHHGPSSIVNLVTKRLADGGIDALALVVSLPQYVVMEEDHLGKVRLLEVLNMLYDIPVDTEDFDRALEQRKLIGEKVDDSPQIKALLPQLEKAYELRLQTAETEGTPRTTSEMEDMLWSATEKDIGKA